MNVYEFTVENAYIFYGYAQGIDLESAMLQVSDYRREKTEKLRKIEDKKLSLMSELLLIYGIEKLGISCNKPFKFIQNEYGKPAIEDLEGWYFNFSHSGDLVVCVISKCEVGVDVELVTRDCSFVAQKYFTKAETELAHKYGTSYVWTRKEAVAKANGRGIGVGVDRIDTSSDVVTLDGEEYNLFTNLVDDYYISVACR